MNRVTSIPIWALFWASLLAVSLLTRTYAPIDETRYVSVAWEMWLNGNFLVPHLNGEIYSHKPPLMFWLFNLGWAVFGVNEWWPRLVPAFFGLASLFLTAHIARRLWPDRPGAGLTASLITISSMLWTVFVTTAMFDMFIVFFTLAGILGILKSWQDNDRTGWIILGAAIGMGILSKGPVILLHTLPLALLAPWWMIGKRPDRWSCWYLGIGLAVLIGAVIGLAWAIPASICGGEEYARAIFWKQSAGRTMESFAHKRPIWWYIPLIPVILAPWMLWPPLWRAFSSLKDNPPSSEVRFCLAWLLPVITAFSLISGKQPHYLLPVFPAFGLLAAHVLNSMGVFKRRDNLLPALFMMLIGAALAALPFLPINSRYSAMLSPAHWGYGYVPIAAGLAIMLHHSQDLRKQILSLSASGILMVIVLHVSLGPVMARSYDMHELSAHIRRLQEKGIPAAFVGKYHGTFNFLGRMEKPLEVISREDILTWAGKNPNGRVIADEKHWLPKRDAVPEYEHAYGLHVIRIWSSSTVMAQGE